MFHPISYACALERHPEAVRVAVDKLRASRSKHRSEQPHVLEWGYFTWLSVRGGVDTRLMEERVGIALQARCGRWYGNAAIPLPLPAEVVDFYRPCCADAVAGHGRSVPGVDG